MAKGQGEMVSVYFSADKVEALHNVQATAKDPKVDRSVNYLIVGAVIDKFGKPAKK